MLKKLGIAAACGIALYGVVRLINRNLIVLTHVPGQFPDLLAPRPEGPEDAATASAAGAPETHEKTLITVGADAAVTEVTCAGEGQVQAQVPDCGTPESTCA
jgi:hypothetical protein